MGHKVINGQSVVKNNKLESLSIISLLNNCCAKSTTYWLLIVFRYHSFIKMSQFFFFFLFSEAFGDDQRIDADTLANKRKSSIRYIE